MKLEVHIEYNSEQPFQAIDIDYIFRITQEDGSVKRHRLTEEIESLESDQSFSYDIPGKEHILKRFVVTVYQKKRIDQYNFLLDAPIDRHQGVLDLEFVYGTVRGMFFVYGYQINLNPIKKYKVKKMFGWTDWLNPWQTPPKKSSKLVEFFRRKP